MFIHCGCEEKCEKKKTLTWFENYRLAFEHGIVLRIVEGTCWKLPFFNLWWHEVIDMCDHWCYYY